MITTTNIEKFRFWCQPIIPLVYENELSYYEVLCKVRDKLNEVINTVNNIHDGILDDVNALITQFQNEIETELNALETKVNIQLNNNLNEVNGLLDQMRLQLQEQQNQIEQQLAQQNLKIDAKILQLQQEVNSQIDLLKLWVTQSNKSIYNYIDEEIKKIIEMLPEITTTQVVNPITGEIEDVGKTIDYLTNLFRIFAEPAGNWDNKNYVRAGEYDAKELTAWEWDLFGWDAVGSAGKKAWEQPVMTMRSPVTGEWDYYKDVVEQVFELMRGDAFSVKTWEEKEFTAEYFDGSNIQAFVFDYQGYLYFTNLIN